MSKAFVLLSGGVDSTTCLAIALKEFNGNVEGISFFYGQRHKREILAAAQFCDIYNIPHSVKDISSLIPKTMLTDPKVKIPSISYSEIKGVSPTYVPFRNGTLLAAATAYTAGEYEAARNSSTDEQWGIYFGAHMEDAQNWAYPDCSPEFIGAMANAIYIGTYHQIRLHTPLEWLNKAQIIQLGESLGVDWKLTFSCYVGGEQHCGVCPTCRARRQGFIDAAVRDPTVYLNNP